MDGRKAESIVHVIGQVRLRRRGAKKFWHARYMTPAGRKEQSLKVTNLKVATRKALKINEMLERGEFSTLADLRTNKNTTFAAFMDEFKRNYSNWGESTWESYKFMLKNLETEFGPVPLIGVTTKQIESYLAQRQDQKELTTATTNRYLSALKTIFKMG